jgi:hypothetical protein
MPAMKLDDVRSIEESDTHFLVDHLKRGRFRIAKAALDEEVAASMRSIAKGKAAAAEALANEPGPDGVTRAAAGAVVDPNADLRAHIAALEEQDAAKRAEDAAAQASLDASMVPPVLDPGVEELIDPTRPSTAAPFTPDPTRTPTDAQQARALDAQQARAFDAEIGYLPELGRFVGRHVAAEVAGIPSMVAPFLSDAELARAGGLRIRDTANGALDALGTFGDRFKAAFPIGEALGGSSQTVPVPAGVMPGAALGEEVAPLAVAPTPAPQPVTPALTPRRAGGAAIGARSGAETGAVAGAHADPGQPTPGDQYLELLQQGLAEEQRAKIALNNAKLRLVEQRDIEIAAKVQPILEEAERAKADAEAQRKWLAENPVSPSGPGSLGVIGMALGAFGSALTGAPNFAMLIVQKRIADDVEAQRFNRGQRENLLESYMKKGLALEDAKKATAAAVTAKYAGQLEAAALQTGNDMIIAQTKQMTAKMMVEAMKSIDDVAISHARALTEPALRRYQIENERLDAEAKRLGMSATRLDMRLKMESAKKTAAANDVQRVFVSGGTIPAEQLAELPREDREAAVQVAPGRFVRARDGEAAKAISKVATASAELEDSVRQMRALRREDGRAWLPGTGEAAKAQALAKRAQLAIKDIGELGTLDKGSANFLEAMVSDPSAVFTTDATVLARLDSIGQWAGERRRAAMNANLLRAPTASITPRRAGE